MLCMLCYVCKDSQTTAYIKYIYADTSCFWLIKMLLPINFNSSVTKQTHTYIYIYILRLSPETQLENWAFCAV